MIGDGCNSCKYLDEGSKQPGRTSGYLYYCKMRHTWVNAAKDSCDSHEPDDARDTATMNEIYKNSADYNNDVTTKGCNRCGNLDTEKKAPGKAGGYMYYCKKKNTYVNAAKDHCELWEEGFRDSLTMNEIYRNSENYSDDNTSMGSYLFILIALILFGIIFSIFFS